MNILDNELVKKYFGCFHETGLENHQRITGICNAVMSERILQAMQEPIRKGNILLMLENNGSVNKDRASCDWGFKLHPMALRLPDKFQKQECECMCNHNEFCNIDHKCCQPQRDEVEDKITEILEYTIDKNKQLSRNDLRELVRLARCG